MHVYHIFRVLGVCIASLVFGFSLVMAQKWSEHLGDTGLSTSLLFTSVHRSFLLFYLTKYVKLTKCRMLLGSCKRNEPPT